MGGEGTKTGVQAISEDFGQAAQKISKDAKAIQEEILETEKSIASLTEGKYQKAIQKAYDKSASGEPKDEKNFLSAIKGYISSGGKLDSLSEDIQELYRLSSADYDMDKIPEAKIKVTTDVQEAKDKLESLKAELKTVQETQTIKVDESAVTPATKAVEDLKAEAKEPVQIKVDVTGENEIKKVTDEIAKVQKEPTKVTVHRRDVDSKQAPATVSIESGVASSEVDNINRLKTAVDSVTSAVLEKTSAFQIEGSSVGAAISAEIDDINRLKSILDQLNESLGNLNGPTNLNSLELLSKVDFSGLNDIKINKTSFDNSITGLKSLASGNLSELQNLSNIDFRGLDNLKYADKATKSLSIQSNDFISSQMKQINKAVESYKKAGLTDDQLKEFSDLSTILNSTFTTSNLMNVPNISAEMGAFVQMFAQAKANCDSLVSSMSSVKAQTEASTKAASTYASLLNKQRTLTDQLFSGKRTAENSTLLSQIQKQMQEIENNPVFNTQEAFQDLFRQSQAMQKDFADKFENTYSSILGKGKARIDKYTAEDFIDMDSFDKLKNPVKELETLLNNVHDTQIISSDDINRANQLSKEIREVYNSMEFRNTKKGTYFTTLDGVSSGEEAMSTLRKMLSAQAESEGNRFNYLGTNKNLTELNYTITTNEGLMRQMSATWDEATGKVTTYVKAEKEYISQGQQFVNSIKGKFGELTRYLSIMDALQAVIGFVRKGITAIVDINTAMTELKKVTDETSISYDNFQKKAGDIATTVGSTTKEIIASTADYARRGNTMEDSAILAQNTAIYKNVGDGIDIETATSDIVSITEAYGIAADKSLDVIDVLNEVGNKYPVSSSGLGEILQRSSSALHAANNTFEESVAMGAAMNAVLQDTSMTGNTLKVLSLRLRGAATEIQD